jgi:hypothetical protein
MALLHAQGTGISGPISAFVYDSALRGVRPILGVPGAALLGGVVVGNLDWAGIAPNEKCGLAVQSGQLVFLPGVASGAASTPIFSISACCQLSAWSADSKTAALYAPSSRQFLLVTNLDTAPQVRALEVPPRIGEVRFLLVDADSIFFGAEAAGIYEVPNNGAPQLLARLEYPRAATFLGTSGNLAILEGGSRKILELRRSAGSASLAPFLDLPDDAREPVGIAASGNQIFVADRSTQSVLVFDMSSHQPGSRLAAHSPPAEIAPLAHGSLFLLGGGGAKPLSLLDASGAGAVYFVPAGSVN